MKLQKLLKEIYPKGYLSIWSLIEGQESEMHEQSVQNKPLNMYVCYPNSFVDKNGKKNFETLTTQVPYLKKMGINAIHVLPFFESPMIDMGFDVSDYMSIRKDLGGNRAFDNFLSKCKDNNIVVFADLILNHVSYQHIWFQKAIQGEEKYRNYFYSSASRPKLIKKYQTIKKLWKAKYLINGKTVSVPIIFPEHCGEISHWRQAQDGYWYFHTFYPHQIDVNWNNPEVFLEYLMIMKYWAHKGLSFRLDAIPYIGKNVDEGVFENWDRTHKIVVVLNRILKFFGHSRSEFLSEAYVPMNQMKEFFVYKGEIQSEYTYNFDLSRELWWFLLTGSEERYLWNVIKKSHAIVKDRKDNAWVLFLKSHDSFSLEELNPKRREYLMQLLASKSMIFRNGRDLTGRTSSWLDENPDRILGAYMLVASLEGVVGMIYGDEIGKLNDEGYMKRQTINKQNLLNDSSIVDDTRDINRGEIESKDQNTSQALYIYEGMSKILNTRYKIQHFLGSEGRKLRTPKGVFGIEYKGETSKLLVYVNVFGSEAIIKKPKNCRVILSIGKVVEHEVNLSLQGYGGVWLEVLG